MNEINSILSKRIVSKLQELRQILSDKSDIKILSEMEDRYSALISIEFGDMSDYTDDERKFAEKTGIAAFTSPFLLRNSYCPCGQCWKKNECLKEEYDIFDDLLEWRHGENAKNPHFEYPQADLDAFEGLVHARKSDTCSYYKSYYDIKEENEMRMSLILNYIGEEDLKDLIKIRYMLREKYGEKDNNGWICLRGIAKEAEKSIIMEGVNRIIKKNSLFLKFLNTKKI
jgi:hypothetical protein